MQRTQAASHTFGANAYFSSTELYVAETCDDCGDILETFADCFA